MIGRAIGRLEVPLFLDDNPRVTVMEIRAKARRLKARHGGLALIVIDYLQLMSGNGNPENRQLEVSEISRNLKILARELEVPIVALSQLSRNLEARADKRPMLSDLRETGSLEQDADVVMFLYRDEVYNPESPDKGSAEVIVAKHRSGPIGTKRLVYLGQYTRFDNAARVRASEPTRSLRAMTANEAAGVSRRPSRHPGGVFLGDDLLAWLVLALGGALLVGNVAAIVRPPAEPRDEAPWSGRRSRAACVMAALGLVAAVWALGVADRRLNARASHSSCPRARRWHGVSMTSTPQPDGHQPPRRRADRAATAGRASPAGQLGLDLDGRRRRRPRPHRGAARRRPRQRLARPRQPAGARRRLPAVGACRRPGCATRACRPAT